MIGQRTMEAQKRKIAEHMLTSRPCVSCRHELTSVSSSKQALADGGANNDD